MEEPVENNVDAAADDFVKMSVHIWLRWLAYIVGGTGVVGNMFVVVVISRHTKLWRKLTYKYIVNQSVIDALTMIVFILRVRTISGESKLLASLNDRQAEVYCHLWSSPFLLYGLLLSSTYNLIAISVERYLAILRPYWHNVSFAHNRVTLSMVGIWLFGVSYMACVVGIPSRMAGGECQPARNWPSQGVQIFVGSTTLCISLVLPLFIHAFCYTRIIVALRMRIQSEVPSTEVWNTNATADLTSVKTTPAPEIAAVTRSSSNTRQTAANSTRKRAESNVLKTLTVVTVAFVVCWIPNKCYVFLYLIGVTSHIGQAYHFTVGLVLFNCCVNPFIYTVRCRAFRKGVTVMCGCKRRVL